MTHAFQSLSIGTRLGAGFALLVGLLFVTAGTSAYQARQMATNARHYADNLVPSYEAEHAVAMSLANARGYASQHVLFRDNEQMDRVEKRLKQARTIAAQQLQRFRGELVSDPADLSLLDATEKAWQHNIKLEDQILDASRAKTYDESKGFEAQALLLGDGRQAYEQAEQALQAWWDHKVTLAAHSVIQARR
jgi:CHASE3 domain sensor protein